MKRASVIMRKKAHNNLFKIKINTVIGILRKSFQPMDKKKIISINCLSQYKKRSSKEVSSNANDNER